MGTRHEREGRRGTSTVELALVLPLIIAMLMGLWEVGRLAEVRQLMMNAAREGGRQASTSQLTNVQIKDVVVDYLKVVDLPTAHAIVTVKNLTNTSLDAKAALQLDRLEVTVTLPYADIRLTNAARISGQETILSAKATWFSMKDKPYADPPEPPPG